MKKYIAVLLVFCFLLASCSKVEDTSYNENESLYRDIFSEATSQSLPENATKSVENTTTIINEQTSPLTSSETTTESTTIPQVTNEAKNTTTKKTETTTTKASTTTTPKSTPTQSPPPSQSPPSTPNPPTNTDYQALNYTEVKGMWLSYIELYSQLSSKTKFENYIKSTFDDIKLGGYNTVYVHVRAFGDALYRSDYFPYAGQSGGSLSENISFDPLQIMIDEGHRRNLSIHAWINPYRIASKSQYSSLNGEYTLKNWWNNSATNTTYIKNVDGNWLNPAIPDVMDLITNGVKEIVKNYNVDGIHFDDYFYPNSVNDSNTSFDKAEFDKSNYTSLRKFRVDNTSKLIKKVYSAVKNMNSSVVFGISPAGNAYQFRSNGLPWNDYIDVKLWASTDGYVDYIAPQIYWSFNGALPYETALNGWIDITKNTKTKLIIGITADAPNSNGFATETDVLKRQAQMALAKTNGVILYRYELVYNPKNSSVNKEVTAMNPIIKG